MLIVNYFLPDKVDMDDMRPLLQLVIYLVEKLKKFKLSREGKNKADKNRLRIEEEYQKNSHSARAELAAQKREEKRKQEKERIMNEEDPEKQRRWEKKEKKRQAKKQTPKLKQLSIKAL
jgi:HD superfamily phosphohydrolase